MNSNEVFIHIHQGCFAGTGAIVRLPQCQWSKPDGYGKISQCITTTKHSKAKTVCIFIGIYCISNYIRSYHYPKQHTQLHMHAVTWCNNDSQKGSHINVMASQITRSSTVCSKGCSDWQHQSPTFLIAFWEEIHRWIPLISDKQSFPCYNVIVWQ